MPWFILMRDLPMAKPTDSYEDKWLFISGTIGGAYLAFQNGADPRRCMQTIWDAHQEALTGDVFKPKKPSRKAR